MNYQRRQEQGRAKRAHYLDRLNTAHHVAVLFRGLAVGNAFVLLMGLTDTSYSVAQFFVMAGALIIGIVSFVLSFHVVHRVEQDR